MARHAYTHLHGGCTCGAFSFETSKAPVARFVCHCLFCQDFTGEAFSDVSVLMAHHVHMKGAGALTHKKYRLPPNLNRARCPQCGNPAMETMGARPLQLVFLPSKSVVEQSLLPPILQSPGRRRGRRPAQIRALLAEPVRHHQDDHGILKRS